MKRDERYDYVHYLYKKGQIKCFNDLFKRLPRSVLAKDMGIDKTRLRELLQSPKRFKLEEIFTIAHFFKISDGEMLKLVHKQIELDNKNKNKIL